MALDWGTLRVRGRTPVQGAQRAQERGTLDTRPGSRGSWPATWSGKGRLRPHGQEERARAACTPVREGPLATEQGCSPRAGRSGGARAALARQEKWGLAPRSTGEELAPHAHRNLGAPSPPRNRKRGAVASRSLGRAGPHASWKTVL